MLDTNVIISAVVGQGAPNRLMRIARKKPIQIYTSAELLNELDDVLRRRKFARRLGQLNLDATAVVAQFQKISTTISVPACYPHVASTAIFLGLPEAASTHSFIAPLPIA